MLLQLDPDSKVATEVFISGTHIIIGGEVKTKVSLDPAFYKDIAKKALKQIGYPEVGFERGETLFPDETDIQVYVSKQSPEIRIEKMKPSRGQLLLLGFFKKELMYC